MFWRWMKRAGLGTAALGGAAMLAASFAGAADTKSAPAVAAQNLTAAVMADEASGGSAHGAVLQRYCIACHNDGVKTAGMSVQSLDPNNIADNVATWEKILRRVSMGEMPPKGMPRPPHAELEGFEQWLTASLDKIAAEHPDPGRAALRRLNRAEYANAVRDLLGVDADVSAQLPGDDSGYGFDNISDVLTVSPTLIDRYMTVASRVAGLATGVASRQPAVTVYKVPKDPNRNIIKGVPAFNERSSDLLPIDSRGGAAFTYFAPYDGEYVISVGLNSNELTDWDPIASTTYEVRARLKAGSRVIGASFRRDLNLDEGVQKLYFTGKLEFGGAVTPENPPKPIALDVWIDGAKAKTFEVPSYVMSKAFFQANFPRDAQSISVTGPFEPGAGPQTRERIFICTPSKEISEADCAAKILANLATQAYRRPVSKDELRLLAKVYSSARRNTDFAHGVKAGIEAILVSPNFLFAQERVPEKIRPGALYDISESELATRLALFLWSSIPDAELRTLAEQSKLRDPVVLKAQVERMVADPRAAALTQNFAGQWLYLRNIDSVRPNVELFPNFDVRLRAAMRAESEMFFDGIVREDRSVLEFIKADYTYLNQRLAEHYGVPNVYGAAFRKVKLDPALNRGGLFGQAAILTVTSYDNRTSVVKRGKWILDNIIFSPPPSPPDDIPAIETHKDGRALTAREQIEMHRANPVCASCHNKMDPLGIALENFDAVGAWREMDAGQKINVATVLPDGVEFTGPAGLKNVLLARKEVFVDAFVERMLTYALGRGVEPTDMATVRAIRRQAAADDYRMHAIILGIVESVPFQKKKAPTT